MYQCWGRLGEDASGTSGDLFHTYTVRNTQRLYLMSCSATYHAMLVSKLSLSLTSRLFIYFLDIISRHPLPSCKVVIPAYVLRILGNTDTANWNSVHPVDGPHTEY